MRVRSAKRKWRRCVACGAVRPATDFKPVVRGFRAEIPKARCPACGRVGPRWAFYEAELPGGAGQGAV